MARSAPAAAAARARPKRREPAPPPKKAPRRRRDAAVARADILDAAARRLVLSGSSGIRLQEVAADAGVSHPTVLHHFGSRELLVEAVIARALEEIHSSLVAAIQSSSGEEQQLGAMLDAVAAVLGGGGHARVILWLALEGHAINSAHGLTAVVDAAHAARLEGCKVTGATPPPREDTAHVVVLSALALVASSVLGPGIFVNAGLGNDEQVVARFRAWLTRLLWTHLDDAPIGKR